MKGSAEVSPNLAELTDFQATSLEVLQMVFKCRTSSFISLACPPSTGWLLGSITIGKKK